MESDSKAHIYHSNFQQAGSGSALTAQSGSSTLRRPISPTIILVPDSDEDQPGPSTSTARRAPARRHPVDRKGKSRSVAEGTSKDPVIVTDGSSIASLEGIEHLFVNKKMDRPFSSQHTSKHRSKLEARRNRSGTASQSSIVKKRVQTSASKPLSSEAIRVNISTQKVRKSLPAGVASLSASFLSRQVQPSSTSVPRKSIIRPDECPPAVVPPSRYPIADISSHQSSATQPPSQITRQAKDVQPDTSTRETPFESRSPERPMRVSEAGPSTITPRLIPSGATWLDGRHDLEEDEAIDSDPYMKRQSEAAPARVHASIAFLNSTNQTRSLGPVPRSSVQLKHDSGPSASADTPQSSNGPLRPVSPQRSLLIQSRSQSPIKIPNIQPSGQRKGGAFGSHKKKCDNGVPRIGRALSRDIRDGRTPAPIASASQASPQRPPPAPLPSSSQSPKRSSTFPIHKPRDSDPSFRMRNKTASQVSSQPDRPKRARPNPGTYVIPLMDSPDWPSRGGTQSVSSKRPRPTDESPPVQKIPNQGHLVYRKRIPIQRTSVSSSLTSLDSFNMTPTGTSTSPSSRSSKVVAEELGDTKDGKGINPELVPQVEAEIVEEAEEVDLLAEWADYDFGGLDEITEAVETEEPSEELAQLDLVAVDCGSENLTLLSNPTTLVASLDNNPTKRRASTQTGEESPAKRQSRPPPVLDLEQIRLEHERMRAEHLREAEEARAERLKQEQAAMEALDEMDDEDDLSDLGDLGRMREDSPPSEMEEQPPVQSKAKPPTFIRPSPNTPLAQLLREHKRETRRGDAGGDAQYLLRTLDEEAAGSYPTPDSMVDRSGVDADLDLDAIAQDLPSEMVDQDLLNELGFEEQEDPAWAGFWLGDVSLCAATTTSEHTTIPDLVVDNVFGRLLQEAVRRNDPAEVSSLIALPQTLHCIHHFPENAQALVKWAFYNALSLEFPKDRFAASRVVVTLCSLPNTPLTAWDLVRPLLLHFGMTVELVSAPSTPLILPAQLALHREEASLLVCEILMVSLKSELEQRVIDYVKVLLPLITDGLSSTCLRMAGDRALCAGWEWLHELGTQPRSVASQLVRMAEALNVPLSGRAQLLINIGRRTHFGQAVMPWFAIGCLCPKSLDEPDRVFDEVPSLDLVEEGIMTIYEAITAESPDHVAIRHLIVLFSESVVNINALMDQLGANMEKKIQKFRNMIIKTANKIQIKGFSKAKDYVNKTELSHIHVNIGQMLKLALVRRERKQRESMKGMIEGQGGQMRLSFGVKTERVPPLKQRGAEDSDDDGE